MSEQRQLIEETARRIFDDLCDKDLVDAAEAGRWPVELWDTLAETGLTLVGISEAAGGSGGDTADAVAVLRLAGSYCVPLPVAETFLAARLIEECGGSVPQGPLTVAVGEFTVDGKGITGSASGVAFADRCRSLLVPIFGEGGWSVHVVAREDAQVTPAVNIAGEPRDDVRLSSAPGLALAGSGNLDDELHALGALTRAAMMAGALESTLQLSVNYALERNQFGRPLAKFQAIQHQLATLAGEVAASVRAAEALAVPDPEVLDIAVAKARIGEAVAASADIAHQVHGAMGYTLEHPLNHRSRRLWCWRDEYGSEVYWQRLIAERFIDHGADELWASIVALP